MRRGVLAGALVLLAGCSGRGEIIPNPAPASNPTTTAEEINTTALAAAPTTEPEPTTIPTTEAPPTTQKPTPPSTVEYLQPEATMAPARITSSQLASIRQCESGGDYTTNTGNGYYGAYQFALSTWRSVGGTGYPHLASPSEQDMRAQMMIDAGRRGEWPSC